MALQQAIVDPRFANDGWRDTINEQNYVGRSVSLTEEEIHFIAPRPQDLAELMAAYLEASRRILNCAVHPVIAAAGIAYPFVFLHPFSDGNGRLHRFLIHYALSFRRFAPDGVVFPISATMLHHPQDYDASLESFSKPLLPLVEYKVDSGGRMTVLNDTRDLYRYVDCTFLAEALFNFVEETIEKELRGNPVLAAIRRGTANDAQGGGPAESPGRHVREAMPAKQWDAVQSQTPASRVQAFREQEIGGLEAAVGEAFALKAKK